jgi:hypothetical protein
MLKNGKPWVCSACLTPIAQQRNVARHKETCRLLKLQSANDAGALSEMPRHKYNSIAHSENDRQNDLVQNESHCEQSFELDYSLDHTTPKCTGQQIKHK